MGQLTDNSRVRQSDSPRKRDRGPNLDPVAKPNHDHNHKTLRWIFGFSDFRPKSVMVR